MIHPVSALAIDGPKCGQPLHLAYRLTRCQRAALQDSRDRLLWRDGNRLGKTYYMAVDLSLRMMGHHPHQKSRVPLRCLAMGPTVGQMVTSGLIPTLWGMLGGDVASGEPGPWIDPRLTYDSARGIVGTKYPYIKLIGGPGKGSLVHFCSYKQGTGRLGGYSAHAVLLDEPPPEQNWSEVLARVLDTAGVIRIGFTPTTTSPDVTYLRRIVEDDERNGRGHWGHHNYHLKVENMLVEGEPWSRLTQRRIDAFIRDLSEREKRMRTEGWWEPSVEGRALDNYDPAVHVRAFSLADIKRAAPNHILVVSMDHGIQAGKQRAVLAAYTGQRSFRPRAWWIAESLILGASTTQKDATAILEMLQLVGLEYDDIDVWTGDRAARAVTSEVKSKSNRQLRAALADQLGRKLSETKKIRPPVKYAGSVDDGVRLLNGILGRRHKGSPSGVVHERCVELARAMDRWDWSKHHPLKDVLDAARYGAEAVCRVERNVSSQLMPITTRRAK